MMYKCSSCGGTSSFIAEMRVKRDTDGLDIWRCSLCEDHFKIDLDEYMRIKSEDLNEVLTTYKLSKGFFKTWWWLLLAIVLVIYAFTDP